MTANQSISILIACWLFLAGTHQLLGQSPNQNPRPPFSSPQQPVKTVTTHLKGFGIPFNINADDAAFIEVQLYLSRDQGRSWKFVARQSTDGQDFPFQATEDGEYWFALKTLDRDRKLLPEGIPQPELKIIVDTVKPKLDFRIQTDAAGRVNCRWKAEDANLSPETFRILYQPITDAGVAQNWVRVPVNLNGTARNGVYADQLAWWPDTSQRILNVAVEIKDVAGNPVQLTRQIVLPQTSWRKRNQSTALITDHNATNVKNPWTVVEPHPARSGQSPPPVRARDSFAQTPTKTPAARVAVQTKPKKQSSAKPASHAGGPVGQVVCKDGVCTLIPAPERIAKQLDPTLIQSGTTSSSDQSSAKLIGSEVEFVDPPVPPGYVSEPNRERINATPISHQKQNAVAHQKPTDTASPPPTRTAQLPNNHQNTNPRSVAWPSETESSGPKFSSDSSTTHQPNPALAPQPVPTRVHRPVTNVPSNAPTTTYQGNQVVSQSTTKGPNNQYRGMNNQQGRPIAPPELLPKTQPNSSSFKNTGHSLHHRTGQGSFHRAGNEQPADARRSVMTAKPPVNGSSSAQSSAAPNRVTRAPSHILGTKRFRLNYGIDAIDPSGVARVDLWMTRDDGQTWNAWGSDPDNQSPFPVEVEEQGRYGFRVVIHSKDGLTGQGPSSGDDADMWVLIDTQPPLARIKSVPYGRGNEAGRLVINYAASDELLTIRPVTLGYSQTPEGPWTLIEQGIRNDGRYVWKVPANVPDKIYLRIEAIDKASNVGVHVLSQIIDVSGLVPRGTIHGVIPVGTN